MRFVAEPYIPFALWLALAVIAIGVWLWYGLTNRMATSPMRRFTILSLMAVTLALPLIVLLNLTWIQNVPPPAGKPVVRLLIDTSASMSTADVDGQSRLVAAKKIATAATGLLADQFDVRVATFDRQLKNSELESINASEALANETNLASAIADSIKDDIPQGQSILLLSDGIHNVGSTTDVLASAIAAQAMDVPVFTATLGGTVGVKNVSVSLRSPQELAFVGQSVPAQVDVESLGLGVRPLKVELYRDGQKLETQEINVGQARVKARLNGRGESTSLKPLPLQSKRLSIPVIFNLTQTEPGLYRYEVRATELADEATHADNRATLLFRVVDRPIKMLLVEGKPYWDTKFLVRRLAADQSVELTSVVRMAEGRYLQRTVARVSQSDSPKQSDSKNTSTDSGVEDTRVIRDADAVLSAQSLANVQIVLLGRNAEFFLGDDSLEALRNWISRDGGSLVCARGAPSAQISQRLSQILPVRWTMGRESRFRVSLTNQGRDLRWLASFGDDDVLGAMPSLASVATAAGRDGLTNVLAATVDSDGENVVPVLSYQPYGSGRTVVVEGAGMWRWALMSPTHSQQEEVYATLWRSLLRWLVSRAGLLPGQNVSLQPDRVSFDTQESATATMLLRQDQITQPPLVRVRTAGDSDAIEGDIVGSDLKGFDQTFSPRPVGQDPGVYRLDFGKLKPGQYMVELVEMGVADAGDGTRIESSRLAVGDVLKTAFDVRERWDETLELDARADLMQRIAETSGGAVLETTTSANLAEEFVEQFAQHLARARPPQFRRVPLWDRWWVLTAILALWSTTWMVRRRSGLV